MDQRGICQKTTANADSQKQVNIARTVRKQFKKKKHVLKKIMQYTVVFIYMLRMYVVYNEEQWVYGRVVHLT